MRFKFCPDCGERLIMKPIGDEGDVPFCERCGQPRFDMFPSAVIVLIINEFGEAALLRQDYMSTQYRVLVSGFMKPCESAEETARREVLEELGIELESNRLVGTYWFAKKDMLMIGFIARAKKCEFTLSGEVDGAEWVPAEEAIKLVHPKGDVSYALLDEYLKRSVSEKFIEDMQSIKWFANSGTPTEKYLLVRSVYDAYDNWNANYLSVWEPRILLLEKSAEQLVGKDAVDDIFATVSMALDKDIWNAWQSFRTHGGLEEENALDEEIADMVKRDLCWAAVERALGNEGFFTALLDIYGDGYFPCGWDGEYPYGRAAVM
ncbi:MAG: NUDIX domain-containing protein [Lachnospiraceae bacterium]|nr:NUDIX domain-containing protein [Ruminococcus sp.]MCM1275069.1 NUDIX domain-containing protein [Lachnospiraceae bacterium]